MFREIISIIVSIIKSRLFVMAILFIALFSVLIYRIFDLQIVNSDKYLNTYIKKAEKERYITASRGLIRDRNGEILAYNELAYAITIEDTIEDSDDDKAEKLNDIIYKTIQIVETNGDTLVNDFSIIQNDTGDLVFSTSSDAATKRFILDIYGKKSEDDLKENEKKILNYTPKQVFDHLKKKYAISKDYSDTDALKIITIRYALALNSYQKYLSTTVASNVSDATVAAIYENEADLSGVSVTQETVRKYVDSMYFAPIIGYTGKGSTDEISKYNSELESDNKKNGVDTTEQEQYVSNDVVGKSGIEAKMELTLHGKKGYETVFVDSTGQVIDVTSKTESEAGNDVYLSIDKNLQIATYNILEQKLAGILISKIVNHDVTITEDSKVIEIPVKNVYNALIDNEVVDLTKFSLDTATENEQNIYAKFTSKQADVLDLINQQLTDEDAPNQSTLSEEMQTYMSYIYDFLIDKDNRTGIKILKDIDEDDDMYVAWDNGTTSLRKFLLYAISKNWLDTTKIEAPSKYTNTEQIYDVLVSYIQNKLTTDKEFSKKIYYYLIQNYTVTGSEVCLLLYDQNVLEYNEDSVNGLSSGSSDYAFNFIVEQIRTLKITPAQLALDPCSGSCVVTDVDTGEVLAMVTYPSYDNNRMSGTVDAAYYAALNEDNSKPLLNRATSTATAPGSTYKMISAITGLEEGVISTTETITDLGEYTKVTPSAKCWKYPSNHGAVNVSKALAVSCNYFFYEVGYRLSFDAEGNFDSDLGLEKLKKYAEMFGLNSLSGIELKGVEPRISDENSVRSAIGQGTNDYTCANLARYVNTLANSGYDYELTLLDRIMDANGNLVTDYTPKLVNTVEISQTTWDAVHDGMRQVVSTGGTAAKTFTNFSIEVAGKSGTAQENKLRSNHAVFVAYAPYSNPEVSLAVLIPNGDSSGYTAEVVRDVLAYYYKQTTDADILNGTATVPESSVTHD